MAKKLYEDDVLVIGLGRFGGAVALELQKLDPERHRVFDRRARFQRIHDYGLLTYRFARMRKRSRSFAP